MAQPYIHDHVTCVAAPATWLSGPSGRLGSGADGLYVEDRRALSRLVVTVDGAEPVPVTVRRTGAASAHFVAVLPGLGHNGDDPTITLSRRRLAEPLGGTETIILANASGAPVAVDVALYVATDFARMGEVRDGAATGAAAPIETGAARTPPHQHIEWQAPDGLTIRIQTTPPPDTQQHADATAHDDDAERAAAGSVPGAEALAAAAAGAGVDWAGADGAARTRAVPGAEALAAAAAGAGADGAARRAAAVLRWRITVPARGRWEAEIRIMRTDIPPIARTKRFSTLRVAADDRRLDALVRAGVQDLDALRRTRGADAHYTAGSPWYLTLFGRDSLWAARLGLPLGTEVAAGTLRALAALQGADHDADTGEEPGKIPHEVRAVDAAYGLPPVYYGTVDATPLFISTLADAYRWGMPAAAVEALLPNARRALRWLAAHDGFVAYDTGGKGLTNQGWKDSGDAIQHADGRVASGPVALSEVQAYAYRAALDGAWLLEQFPQAPDGEPDRGPDGQGEWWRTWARDLADRFRAAFWCPGGYPAIALDGSGAPVDGIASNMGHLLGTGLLTAQESATVAAHLAELRSPFGIRTLAPSSTGYNFLSYHLGSVWPHDNAIALLGLARDGHRPDASALIRALLDAAERFDFRLPELFGGDDLPTAYPTACRPQAWAAAAGPAILTALLGLDVDVPAGRITFAPLAPSPVGAFRVRGLKVADAELDVSVTAAGALTIHNGPIGVTFHEAGGAPARVGRPTSAA